MDRKKYFFFDIDGTIAVGMPRYVPKSTEKTLNILKEEGHFISIATGRMYSMAVDFCEKFGIKNMVTDGGNGVVIDGKKEVEALDKNMMDKILDVFDKRDIPWSICVDDERVWYTKDERFPKAMEGVIKIPNYMTTRIDKNLDFRKLDKIYKGFAYLDIETEKRIKELKDVSYTRYHDEYIILEADDKSKGIKKIMEKMGIENRDVVVYGDNTNDIKMFRSEWTSIAMGNSVDSLKKVADYVTTDADKDGIENACRHFGWIK
ncbi:HAD family hydrolase [Peptostreptococcus russellii]|uniref:HAD family hydrolase n=1 Tax=Peptostreptococcus russellii TaxID=215200 RepID=UPI0029427E71|nr:HAD family hydrolase [Peptostreptococcus russellii]